MPNDTILCERCSTEVRDCNASLRQVYWGLVHGGSKVTVKNLLLCPHCAVSIDNGAYPFPSITKPWGEMAS
jgi:hypothetical protein